MNIGVYSRYEVQVRHHFFRSTAIYDLVFVTIYSSLERERERDEYIHGLCMYDSSSYTEYFVFRIYGGVYFVLGVTVPMYAE